MKTEETKWDEAAVEREFESLAPMFREAMRTQAGPSERVLSAIRLEAASRSRELSRRATWLHAWSFRRIAKIAAVLLLVAGGFSAYRYAMPDKPVPVASHRNVGFTELDADYMLDIQGMDTESFEAAADSLWL
ncbi:MAG: hypothetical protein IJR99_09675 [Kiritimatiellae bacterium]|nr:hypothetical protein [Kiritimatiellia bacterium]